MMKENIERLKQVIDDSQYTVALCGSGMLEESGLLGVKKPDRAYEIEKKYKTSPEYIFSSNYYNTRPTQFFEFYINEMLTDLPIPTESGAALAALEQAGKLQCIVTSNMYELSQQAGCKNVINLRGSIYKNRCPRCQKEYSMEYMKKTGKPPLCEVCGTTIRPLVSLFGEMVDSQLMTRVIEEISKADVLLLLGTSLSSDAYATYIKYFQGKFLAIIHQREHFQDKKADLVIIDQPRKVLCQLVSIPYQEDSEACGKPEETSQLLFD